MFFSQSLQVPSWIWKYWILHLLAFRCIHIDRRGALILPCNFIAYCRANDKVLALPSHVRLLLWIIDRLGRGSAHRLGDIKSRPLTTIHNSYWGPRFLDCRAVLRLIGTSLRIWILSLRWSPRSSKQGISIWNNFWLYHMSYIPFYSISFL